MPRQPHPLALVGRELAGDFISTITFAVLFALTQNARLSVAAGMVLGIAQVGRRLIARLPIDTMQWLSLGLVVVFGGSSLLTGNPRFVMFKPTLIYGIVALAMLKRGWMARYMGEIVGQWAPDVRDGFGYVWAALMLATGIANLVLALWASPQIWGLFVAVFPLSSKLVLILLQYLITRRIVRGRMRRAGIGAA